jgi:hypothetical protein
MYMIIFLLIYKVFASFLKDYNILKKYEKGIKSIYNESNRLQINNSLLNKKFKYEFYLIILSSDQDQMVLGIILFFL